MRANDLFGTVLGSLKRAKLRLIMTSAGVMIGTASVVLMVAVGFGMERSITQQFEQFAIATDIRVSPGQANVDAAGAVSTSSNRTAPKLDDAAIAEFEKMPAVKAVMPQVGFGGMMTYKSYNFAQQFYALDMRRLEEWGSKLDSGRFPLGQNEVIIGYAVPVIMLAGDGALQGDPSAAGQPRLDLLDKQVKIEFQGTYGPESVEPPASVIKKLRVVGILKAADFMQDMTVYVPMKTAERYAGVDVRKVEYQEVTVRARAVADVEQLAKDIGDMGFQASSPGAEMSATQGVFRIVQLVLGAIGGIALLVASIGIANTMTMATYERTREIGIMKAVGASGVQIRRMFLLEAAVIGLLGGVGGLVLAMASAGLGNLLIAGMGNGANSPFGSGGSLFYISVPLALFAVAFSAIVGLVAGTLPAVRAANLDPLAALRHE